MANPDVKPYYQEQLERDLERTEIFLADELTRLERNTDLTMEALFQVRIAMYKRSVEDIKIALAELAKADVKETDPGFIVKEATS